MSQIIKKAGEVKPSFAKATVVTYQEPMLKIPKINATCIYRNNWKQAS